MTIDSTTIITLIIFFVVGVSSFTHNRQIANYVARSGTSPLKRFFSGKLWVEKEQQRAEKFMRVLVYGVGIFCFISIAILLTAVIFGS